MPRIRYLKPEFFSDEDLAELKYETRIAFEGLWCFADKAGRLENRPKYLKAMIFPYDRIDFKEQLVLLSRKPFIQLYVVDDRPYIQIINWEKHQKPHHTESNSKIPPAPPLNKDKGNGECHAEKLELSNGATTVKAPLKPERASTAQKDFLSNIKENPAFSHIDIDDELHKMDAWLLLPKNKGRKKTPRFVLNWLNKIERPLQSEQIKPLPAEPLKYVDRDGSVKEFN